MKNNPFITPFNGRWPQIHSEAFVDVSARLIGQVFLAEGANVWPMAVLRADDAEVRIGRRSAVLDLALVEAPAGKPAIIGDGALVSHNAAIHGATIESGALVGIGAIVLDKAVIGEGSLIGAGAVVTPGTRIPPNSLVLGAPGKVIRPTTEEERRTIVEQVMELYRKSRLYLSEGSSVSEDRP